MHLGLASAVPLTEKPLPTPRAGHASWPGPRGAAGLGNHIIPNSQVNKLFSLNYRKGKDKQSGEGGLAAFCKQLGTGNIVSSNILPLHASRSSVVVGLFERGDEKN